MESPTRATGRERPGGGAPSFDRGLTGTTPDLAAEGLGAGGEALEVAAEEGAAAGLAEGAGVAEELVFCAEVVVFAVFGAEGAGFLPFDETGNVFFVEGAEVDDLAGLRGEDS